MDTQPVGIVRILATWHPIILGAWYAALTIGVIQFLRWLKERTMYDVAFSANLGGIALGLVTGDGVLLLQHQKYLPSWMGYTSQLVVCVASLVFGWLWWFFDGMGKRKQDPPVKFQWADQCHHALSFPVQISTFVISLVVIYLYGTKTDLWVATVLIDLWVYLFGVDIIQGNMDQRKKMEETIGAKFPS